MSTNAVNVIGMISRMTENIKSSLGMENPTEQLPRPANPDLSRVPLAIRTSFLVEEIITGDRGMPGKLGITRYSDNLKDFRTRMNEFSTASQTTNIVSQLSKQFAAPGSPTAFEKDLARTLKVRMPDGTLLANGEQNLAAGKDKILQTITGDTTATFESASPTDKMKARIVMTVMNQSCNAITLTAFAQSLNRDPTGKMPPFSFSERNDTRVEEHSIRREENGLLAGMWSLPNVDEALNAEEAFMRAESFSVQPQSLVATVHRTHIFTHIRWEMDAYTILCGEKNDRFIWRTPAEIRRDYALPTAFRKFLEE